MTGPWSGADLVLAWLVDHDLEVFLGWIIVGAVGWLISATSS